MSGSVTSARASDTRIFMPPDSSRGKASAKSASPTLASASSARPRRLGLRQRAQASTAAARFRARWSTASGSAPGTRSRCRAPAAPRPHGATPAPCRTTGALRPCDHAQRRRLAAAGRAQQRDELAPAHGEIERTERHDAIVIDLRHAAQADGQGRQAGLDPGRSFDVDDMDLALRLGGAQLDTDALVDETQRVGLAVSRDRA